WSCRSCAPVARACSATSAFQSCRGFMAPPDSIRETRPRSGVLHAGDTSEGSDETAPVRALLVEDSAALISDAVIAAAARPGFLDPSAADPAAILHSIERRVERRQREAQRPVR